MIGPYVTIGPKSVIHESIISNSIIGDDAHIQSAVVTASLIGNRCKVKGRHHKINIGASGELEL